MKPSAQIPPTLGYLDSPTLVREVDSVKFYWGDAQSGHTFDRFYAATPNLQVMAFRMPVGGWFAMSERFKPFYNATETYYCLKGEFTFHCPQTGEVHVVMEGDCVYFPPETWHFGYNFGTETCMILEALTPSSIEAVDQFSAEAPVLETVRLIPDGVLGQLFPGSERPSGRTALVRGHQHVHEIVGSNNPIRVDLICSTEKLTTGVINLSPGQISDRIAHPGDLMLYVERGMLNIRIWDTEDWFEAHIRDVCFVPAGLEYSLHNVWDDPVRLVLNVAPQYR